MPAAAGLCRFGQHCGHLLLPLLVGESQSQQQQQQQQQQRQVSLDAAAAPVV
jgi:hypothetical protein